MISPRLKMLIAIALVAFAAGVGAALVRGFWGVSQDCHEWVDRNGYHLVHNHWWAKTNGCVATTAAGDERSHSEELRNKARGWAWQAVIFAAGALPAVAIITLRRRRNGP